MARRKAFLASRLNTMLSIPMLFFMAVAGVIIPFTSDFKKKL